jgi:hypothetical protein
MTKVTKLAFELLKQLPTDEKSLTYLRIVQEIIEWESAKTFNVTVVDLAIRFRALCDELDVIASIAFLDDKVMIGKTINKTDVEISYYTYFRFHHYLLSEESKLKLLSNL